MPSTPLKRVTVEIISDSVCPWCYIGKRRFERAAKKYADRFQFEVRWLPFQLNPNASQDGVEKKKFYNEKFGAERVAQMIPQMANTFAAEGLQYTMDGRTGNTFNSHRLIHWAGQFGSDKQNALVEALFKSYFSEGKFINDPDVLIAAAEEAGLKGAAEVVNNPQAEAEEVKEELKRGHRVNGVPHFIIDGRYEVHGAQSPANFEAIFNRL